MSARRWVDPLFAQNARHAGQVRRVLDGIVRLRFSPRWPTSEGKRKCQPGLPPTSPKVPGKVATGQRFRRRLSRTRGNSRSDYQRRFGRVERYPCQVDTFSVSGQAAASLADARATAEIVLSSRYAELPRRWRHHRQIWRVLRAGALQTYERWFHDSVVRSVAARRRSRPQPHPQRILSGGDGEVRNSTAGRAFTFGHPRPPQNISISQQMLVVSTSGGSR